MENCAHFVFDCGNHFRTQELLHCILVCMVMKHDLDSDCSQLFTQHGKHLYNAYFSAWVQVQEELEKQHLLMSTADLLNGMQRAFDDIARRQNRDPNVMILEFTPVMKLVRPLLHVRDLHMSSFWKVQGNNVVRKLHATSDELTITPYEVRMTKKYNKKNEWKKEGEDDLKDQYGGKVNRDLLKLVQVLDRQCALNEMTLSTFHNNRELPIPSLPHQSNHTSNVPPPPPFPPIHVNAAIS